MIYDGTSTVRPVEDDIEEGIFEVPARFMVDWAHRAKRRHEWDFCLGIKLCVHFMRKVERCFLFIVFREINTVQSMVPVQNSQSGFESKRNISLIKEYRFKECEWTVYELSSSNESLFVVFDLWSIEFVALKRDYDLRRGIVFCAHSASIWTTLAEGALRERMLSHWNVRRVGTKHNATALICKFLRFLMMQSIDQNVKVRHHRRGCIHSRWRRKWTLYSASQSVKPSSASERTPCVGCYRCNIPGIGYVGFMLLIWHFLKC